MMRDGRYTMNSSRGWSITTQADNGRPLVTLDVLGFTRATVAVYLATGAWDGASLAIQRSLDRERSSAFGTPVALSADGMTDVLDVAGIPYLALVVSIPSATAGTTVDVFWYGDNAAVA